MENNKQKLLSRWRLVLGKYAQQQLDVSLSADMSRMERALDYLYSREYKGRGVKPSSGEASLDPSQLTIPDWLGEVKKLFPKDSAKIIEKHALERYELTELLNNPESLKQLEPDLDLLRLLLAFKGNIDPSLMQQIRDIIQKVIDNLVRKLKSSIQQKLTGKINRSLSSKIKIRQNFDWQKTVRKNLKNYDADLNKIIYQDLRFFARSKRYFPWHVILCVDQSASMANSLIYSTVMAAILFNMPSIQVNLVLFDTSVIDMSDQIDDPVEIMLSVQLGGGTNIAKAMRYCEQLLTTPQRTIMVLISDFEEGGSVTELIASCRRFKESGANLLGLAALDESGSPQYDHNMASRLAANGMDVAALTPNELAEWMAKIIA